jgi:hypothetical protein
LRKHKDVLLTNCLTFPQLYVGVEDRRPVLKELEKIGQYILYGSGPQRKSHIVYLSEGAGKSRLALDFAKKGQKVVFGCKRWDQAFE